jgi:hypothetical protein
LAIFTAIRRASSLVSNIAAGRAVPNIAHIHSLLDRLPVL